MNKACCVGILALLTACGDAVQDAPKPGETVVLPTIEWRVHDRLTLEEVYRESGQNIGPRDRLHGFAGFDADGQAVIYTLPPKRVNDGVACTIGHEVLHIALGAYHD